MVPGKPQWLLLPNFSKAGPERLSDKGDSSRGCASGDLGPVAGAQGRTHCGLFQALRVTHEKECANWYSAASLRAGLSAAVQLDGTHTLKPRM